MTEHVMLKTESVQSSSLNKVKSGQSSDTTSAKQSGGGDFSTEFSKQIDQAKQHPTQTTNSSKHAKPEKTGQEDGKKLPQKTDNANSTAEAKPLANKQTEKKQKTDASSDQQTAVDEKAQHNKLNSPAKPENAHQPEKTSVPVASDIPEETVKKQPQQQKHAPASEKSKHGESVPDKVVTVDEHAVQHVATGKVSMQAHQHHTEKKKDKATATQTESTQQHSVIPVDAASHSDNSQQHETKKVESTSTTKQAEAATSVSTNTDAPKSVIASDNRVKTDQDTQQNNTKVMTQLTSAQGKLLQHRQRPLSHPLSTQIQHNNAVEVADKSSATKTTSTVVDSSVDNGNKATDKTAPTLRPDIMHALKQRGESGSDKLTAFKTVQKTMTDDASHLANLAKQAQPVAATVSPARTDAFTSVLPSPQSTSGSVVTAGTTPQAGIQSSMTAQTAMLDIQPTMQSAAWAKVMSSRVIWMAKEGIQRAQIKLNPANLGPIEVRLHMHNDQASVTFVAHHAMTRDALEQALPKLRDSFVDNGLALTNAEVSQQQYSGNQSGAEAGQHESMNNEIIVQANANEDDILSETEHAGDSAIAGLSLYA